MAESIIGCNIKNLRKKFFPGDGGVGICADAIKVHPQQWRDWEAGKHTPRAKYQQKIAQLFKIKVSELSRSEILTIEDEMSRSRADSKKQVLRSWRERLEDKLDFGSKRDIEIPIWGSAAAATDGQDEFLDEDAFESMEIPAGVGAVIVRGKSMEPLVWNGQKVFLRPSNEEPKVGDLVVVWTNESGSTRHYFKRWIKKTKDGVELESVNKEEGIQEKVVIDAADFGGVRIIIGVWYG